MEKYYTPEIEEFHVGFEFEAPNQKDKRSWTKCVFMDGESAEKYCDEYESRVKYLDRDCIESLGWEYKEDRGMSENNGSLFTKKHKQRVQWECALYFWNYSKRVSIKTVYGTLFEGIIKNKSELRKLLKQLGI